MIYVSHLSRVLTVIAALGLLLSCAQITLAQSGRRARKPEPEPTPVATPEPTPTPKPVDKDKTITLIVGMDRYNGFSTIPLQYYDSVIQGCVDRLDDAPAVKAEPMHKEINRGSAMELAKTEKTAYVVLLQLQVDNINADPSTVSDMSQLYLEYSVFEPVTAKVITRGHAYQGARRKGVIVAPSTTGRTNGVYSEYLLKQAAREAAERILDALKINMGRQLPKGFTSAFAPRPDTTDRSSPGTSRQSRAASLSKLVSTRHLQ